MARVVKVNLLLEAARFIRGVRESKKATDDLADGIEGVGRSSDETTESTEQLGGSLDDLAANARKLDSQIDKTKTGIRDLARQIAATSDEAARSDLSKKLRIEQGNLRKQLNLRKLMEAEADDAARGFAARFGGSIGPLMASAPIGPGAAAAGGALAAAMAPSLAAGVAGAVAGGVGVGGVIGGVALAARDPVVKAAGADLGEFILGDLTSRASGFTPVVLDAIDDIREGWRSLGPDLDRVFKANRFVDPLVAGAVSGVRRVVAGIADVMDEADPAVDALATGMDRLGDAVGDTLSLLAEDADEGAAAIDDLTLAMSSLVRVTGQLVHAGAVLKGWTEDLDTAVDRGRYWIEDNSYLAEKLRAVGVELDITADGFKAGTAEAEAYRKATLGTAGAADFATLKAAGMTDAQIAAADASGTFRTKTDSAAEGVRGVGRAAEDAVPPVQTFAQFLNESLGRALSEEEANLRLEQALLRVGKAAKEGAGEGIKGNTEASAANKEALLSLAGQANATAAVILENTGSHELAAEATEKGRKAFLSAASAMGVEKGEAIALANKLFGIPKNVKSNVDANTGPARTKVQSYKDWLASVYLDKTSTIYQRVITEQYTARGGRREFNRWGGLHEGGVRHMAAGGVLDAHITRQPMVIYGERETGGEAFVPRYGNYARSMAILDRAAGWYGAQVTPRYLPGRASAAAMPAADGGASFSPAQLATAVRSALLGVTVQMDGRAVGYIQGRQVDILSR